MAQIILDSNNNLIQGDFDNATLNNRTKLQTTTTNATTNVYVAPNGSATSAGVSVANNSSLTNASKIVMATNGTTDTQIISGINGSGTYLPLSFYTNNALAMQIDTSQRVGIGTASPGYLLNVSGNGGGGDSAQFVRITDTSTANSIGPLHLTIGAANHFASNPSPVLCGTNGIAFGAGDGSDLATQRKLIIDSVGNFSAVIPSGTVNYSAFFARAWVKFNGTGTPAINGSGNVTSITDNGTGDYTINFTIAMPDTNYSVVSGNNWSGTGAFITINPNTPIYSTTQVKLAVIDRNGSAQDVSIVTSAIFR